MGEHVFGGDMESYGAAVGFSKSWMHRILNSTARLRLSTFTKFVESGVVEAEWLFCGTGPMRKHKTDADTFLPVNPAGGSSQPLFDTALIDPELFAKNKTPSASLANPLRPVDQILPAIKGLARDMFEARLAFKPVLLYVTDNLLELGCGPLICAFLRNKWITAIALPSSAVSADLQLPPTELAAILNNAAVRNIGAGEAFGNWALTGAERRANSVISTAYDMGLPVFVQTTIGDSLMHVAPVVAGTKFNAAVCMTAYVDMLAFIEFIRTATNGGASSVFIYTGPDSSSASNVLTMALAASCATPRHVFAAPIMSYINDSTWESYSEILSQLYSACEAVYKGVTDGYANSGQTEKISG